MDHSTATTPRPSGIPRLSRLPVLRTKSSQTFTPAPSIPDTYRPTAATPKLQKRASYASLPRTAQTPAKDVANSKATAATSRPPLSGSTSYDRLATGTLRGLTRPSSRGNPQRMMAAAKQRVQTEDEENHDQLSSLNGFRAASRQGSHDDASPVEYEEPAEPDAELFRPRDRTKSRPSLSERTMESLQGMPSTPKDRRRSSFFSPVESPMGPPLRPASALSRNGSSGHSRPGTSDGSFARAVRPASPAKRAPTSSKPAVKTNGPGLTFGLTPASAKRRSISTAFGGKPLPSPMAPLPRSPSPVKHSVPALGSSVRSPSKPLAGSKTMAARHSKPRAALGDIFSPHTNGTTAPGKPTTDRKPRLLSTPAKRVASNPTTGSSTALREQIAAAKAAARKEKIKHDSPQQALTAHFEAFEGSKHGDPFNLAPKDSKYILRNRVKGALTDGKLNIAGMGLSRIPDEVMRMYDAKAMEEANVNWAEVVDLTKVIAADNEIEELEDVFFPDTPAEQWAESEEGQGSPFGGLEVLDLHGNGLTTLPVGMRRLERMTKLDLAHNKLDNSCLDSISQMQSLRELRLGHNNFSGNLPSAICGLSHLEVLDVQANQLLGLPEALREILTAIPMEALQSLPLLDLDASGNALIGSLFPLGGGGGGHSSLQTLNVANNSLAALTFAESLELPKLRTLSVANNHLTGLPDVSTWAELVTLAAGDNKITDLPVGLTTLQRLRNVNFTSNELRTLHPEIARMTSLEILILSANPLRERKYLTMTAADIKRDLASKLAPAEDSHEGELSDPETVVGPPGTLSKSSLWTVQANGLLDLASSRLGDDVNDRLGSTLRTNEVRQLHLQHNLLTHVPPALWLGQDLRVLDLSNNPFAAEDYFSAELELPVLQELNLSFCRLRNLEPLLTLLSAPNLRVLNLTANRFTGAVPRVRDVYPSLTTLYARDSAFDEVSADALRGLVHVDLAGNALAALPAEIGLLWEAGLRGLEVGGNAFRVPGHAVLWKGTEAVCRWLRGKLPEGHDAWTS
ncbi:hypothetical protein LTR53_013772 [Teratosphaeriaceae sp. CCFEE 6253]|nr:hypothetical protein LTR53_013772 [Teratosphaeriaceae sp. CCFEE 6253]